MTAKWNPISTAPKDRTIILAVLQGNDFPHAVYFGNARRSDSKRGKHCWRIAWDHCAISEWNEPTIWMPCPKVKP